MEAATVRMYREEYAALPAAKGVNEAAVRAGTMPVKLRYFEAQISDIVDGYRESLLKDMPDLHEQKVNGFALSVKRALSDELLRGLRRSLPADMLLRRLDQVFRTNASPLEKAMFMYRFEADGDKSTCSVCSHYGGKLFTSADIEELEIAPPLHPNCRCKLVSLAQGPQREYTESEISYAEKLGISQAALGALRSSTDFADILFVENVGFLAGWDFEYLSEDKILSALYILKNSDGETARKLLKEAGFREAGRWRLLDGDEIALFFLAYEMAAKGKLLSELDIEKWQRQYAEITAITALTLGSLVHGLLTGTAFDPATGYSTRSVWDQLKKNGYLTPAQQQIMNTPISQWSGSAEGAGKWTNPDGSIKWPSNNGFDGTPSNKTLQPGTRIDRYGGETGSFVSPEGTPYANRSLPAGSETRPYNVYEVAKPIDVQSGKIAPWFDQPSGGVQYQFNQTIEELIGSGYLRRLP